MSRGSPLLFVQIVSVAVWVLVCLAVVVSSRAVGDDHRRSGAVLTAGALAVLVSWGIAVPILTSGWAEVVLVRTARICRDSVPPQPALQVCVYQGVDPRLDDLLATYAVVQRSAAQHGGLDILPRRVVQVAEIPDNRSGWLSSEVTRSGEESSASLEALLPGRRCPQLAGDQLSNPTAEYLGAMQRAASTIEAMAHGADVATWPLQPAALRDYVTAAARCDLAAAARA